MQRGINPDAFDFDLVPGVGMPAGGGHTMYPVRPILVVEGHVSLQVKDVGLKLLVQGDRVSVFADPEALGAEQMGWIRFLDEVDDRARV